jgi:hypothetical protein
MSRDQMNGLHAVDVTLRSPASDCFYFGISIPFPILRAEILARDGRFPLLDHAFPIAKMEGRASKGDCRSAGLRPLRGACRNAFDHVAQLAAQ